MKLFIVFLLAFASDLIQSGLSQLDVSGKESIIVWTGTKVWGKHQGVVKISEGKILMKDQRLSSGYFVIDMKSIECTDIPEHEPVPKKKLEAHLKDPDFFDVDRFPFAKFEVKETMTVPDDLFRLIAIGDLTIKNVTKQIQVEIIISKQTDSLFIGRADLHFNRQHWNIAFKGIGDEMVHDQVTLNVFIKAERK